VQSAGEDIVTQLKSKVLQQLSLWGRLHQRALPKKVLVYRDGVGESQYYAVLVREVLAFKQAFNEAYGGDPKTWPKLTMVVIGKRHHVRFYPTPGTHQNSYDNKTNNPMPGTVVGRGVTRVREWDFFLQSHATLAGTARPAHHMVIKGENNFSSDGFEGLVCNEKVIRYLNFLATLTHYSTDQLPLLHLQPCY
jgi:eukaryotic translation initiation factor 2C